MVRSLLLAATLLISMRASAVPPEVALVKAVKIAERFIARNHISNEDRFLASVTWHEDYEHPEESYWSLLWMPKETGRADAQLVVRVFANGEIKYQDSWA